MQIRKYTLDEVYQGDGKFSYFLQRENYSIEKETPKQFKLVRVNDYAISKVDKDQCNHIVTPCGATRYWDAEDTPVEKVEEVFKQHLAKLIEKENERHAAVMANLEDKSKFVFRVGA